MRKELIVCDCCGAKIESPNNLQWHMRPSHVEIKCPRDGVNGGLWSMDVCFRCRSLLNEKIETTVYNLRHPDVAKEVGAFADSAEELMPHVHQNGFSTIRNIAETIMRTLGANEHDWGLRDKVIMSANHWLETDRRILAATASSELRKQLTEARSLIETSLGLEYRDGGYFPLDDCNHDDEVEAMEALRKEHEVGRQ